METDSTAKPALLLLCTFPSLSIHLLFLFSSFSRPEGSTCVPVAYRCSFEPRHPSLTPPPPNSESGGCLRFSVSCFSTPCTSRLEPSAGSRGNVPGASVLDSFVARRVLPAEARRASRGSGTTSVKKLCVKTPDMCTKGDSVCFLLKVLNYFLFWIIDCDDFCLSSLKKCFCFCQFVINHLWDVPHVLAPSFRKVRLHWNLLFLKRNYTG